MSTTNADSTPVLSGGDSQAKGLRTEEASGLWRSETMIKMDLTIPREAAHDTIFHLGLLGCCQFVDVQEGMVAFQRPFTADIRRCEDAERRLRFIGEQLKLANVDTPMTIEAPTIHDAPSLRRREDDTAATVPQASSHTLNRVEDALMSKERELRASTSALSEMRHQIKRLRESIVVQRKVHEPLGGYGAADAEGGSIRGGAGGVFSSRSVAGIIMTSRLDILERLVFRVSRGNAVLRLFDLSEEDNTSLQVDPEDPNDIALDAATIGGGPMSMAAPSSPASGDATAAAAQTSSVFVVYCHAPLMLTRIRKVCETSGARVYDEVSNHNQRGELETLMATYRQTREQRQEMLIRCAHGHASSAQFLTLEKAVLSTLNLCRYTDVMCRATIWFPVQREQDVRQSLTAATNVACVSAPTIVSRSPSQRNPPTYFCTNKYLSIFQGIVDSYGVARYKEVNPGVFTIITFPYLFGIMYGDIGHGVLLTLSAIALIAFESRFEGKKLNEIFGMLFSGRYLLLLMGLFATYVGILYNDFFGFSVGLFKSGYVWPALPADGGQGGIVHPMKPDHVMVKPEFPYVFGIDVAWAETENKLEFYNSIKMKCAVIVGVIQMLAGIVLSLLNHIRSGQRYKIWCLFVPEFIFLSFTFGYMSLLIVVKWCMEWPNTSTAPSLLETMTNFFLSPGSVTKPMFAGQGALQGFLLIGAFCMAPIMLFVAPRMEKKAMQDKLRHRPATSCAANYDAVEVADDTTNNDDDDGHDDTPHDDTEITIHYIIHTIEFVLGAVSNTASYLRLWALSLAHAQLSEVFFRFGIVQTISMDTTGIFTFVGAGVWFGATIGVLLFMESLSAFLHSLRLHWVEFQNKFYSGDGIAFAPLDLVATATEPSSM